MSSPMIGTPTVARVAATLLTLTAAAAVVLMPAFLLWLAWSWAAPLVLELDTTTVTR